MIFRLFFSDDRTIINEADVNFGKAIPTTKKSRKTKGKVNNLSN